MSFPNTDFGVQNDIRGELFIENLNDMWVVMKLTLYLQEVYKGKQVYM